MQQQVFRIGEFGGGVRGRAGHRVGVREHEFADELLHRPALLLHETCCEMVEQFTMRRRLAEHSEIIHGRHDAASEKMVPHAVHDDAGGERIRRVGDLAREFEPAGAGGKFLRLRPRDRLDKTPRRGLAGQFRLAAHEHELLHAASVEHRRCGVRFGLYLRDQCRLRARKRRKCGGQLRLPGLLFTLEKIRAPHEPVCDRRSGRGGRELVLAHELGGL